MDNKMVDTREIKHHEILKGGGVGTHVTSIVPKLDNKTSGSEGGVTEERPIPQLRCVSNNDVQ